MIKFIKYILTIYPKTNFLTKFDIINFKIDSKIV